jgi:hypothetical protein
MKERRGAYGVLLGTPKGRKPSVYRRIILKLILEK